MSNSIVKEWINEDGIECCLREDGKTYKTLIKGKHFTNEEGEITGLSLDEDYRKLVQAHLRKIELQKANPYGTY